MKTLDQDQLIDFISLHLQIWALEKTVETYEDASGLNASDAFDEIRGDFLHDLDIELKRESER